MGWKICWGLIMKTLIIFYSLSGNTQKVAESVASACGADIEQLRDVKNRKHLFGYMRSCYEVLFSRHAQIQPVRSDAALYDLVILGAPVWIMRLASPMRAYIAKHKPKFNKVAFFCTEGSSGAKTVFKTMATLCDQQPVATLEVTETDLNSGGDAEKIENFIQALQMPEDNFQSNAIA